MRQIKTLDYADARKVVASVIEEASVSGSPVAVAIIGISDNLIAFGAMDDVLPVSIQLAMNKAHTALALQQDTISLEGKDPANFTDSRFTCFGGGVLICDRGIIIGAVGVSGRKSRRSGRDTESQDHELAFCAAKGFML